MRRMILSGLAVLATATMIRAQAPPAAAPEPVQAKRVMMIAPAPIFERVGRAEAVVTGKVTSIEEKSVMAPVILGAKEKMEYLVAVVKIDDPIQGAKGLTHIKVGFLAPQAPAPGGVIRPGLGRGQAKLEKDEEVLLFLTPHNSGEFQVMEAYFDVVDKKADTYEKDLEAAKKYAKLLAEPEKGLKSKDTIERLTTAAMLIAKYRSPRPSAKEPKEEPIDGGTSKLILNALADADWTPAKPGGLAVNNQLMPLNLFFRLNLTDKDGWKPPMDGNKFAEAAQQWIKDNKDKYVLKRFVVEKDEKKDK
ncbi:MAG TPA: hypothetical protein VGX70_23800 [Gemmataceae bacterium]|nr:hypothetical protein [Gemmataceae bacterium]